MLIDNLKKIPIEQLICMFSHFYTPERRKAYYVIPISVRHDLNVFYRGFISVLIWPGFCFWKLCWISFKPCWKFNYKIFWCLTSVCIANQCCLESFLLQKNVKFLWELYWREFLLFSYASNYLKRTPKQSWNKILGI